MPTQRLTKHNAKMLRSALKLLMDLGADAMLILLEGSTDWERIAEMAKEEEVDKTMVVAVDSIEDLDGASEAGLKPLALNKEKARCWNVYNMLSWKPRPMS